MYLLFQRIFETEKKEKITNNIEKYLLKNYNRILIFSVIALLFFNIAVNKKTINELRGMINEINNGINEKNSQLATIERFHRKLFTNVSYFQKEIQELKENINDSEIKILNLISGKNNKESLFNQLKFTKTIKKKYENYRQYLITDANKNENYSFYFKIVRADSLDVITPSLAVVDNNNRILFFLYFDGHESSNELFMARDYIYALLNNIESIDR